MSSSPTNSYDDVPYSSRPYSSCHPDCLAVMGTLLGMSPAPVARCRVLEIGCAAGGNLLPVALQHPASQFVGIDLSPVQIAAGQETVRDLSIANLDLRAMSLLDVDASWGEFDYIICHGVFSWVPEAVRAKIFSICQTNLAPNGIVYISYNTYPGWFARKTLRDVMNYHVKRFPDPATRVAQAREFLEFLDKFGLPTDSPSSAALRDLIRGLRTEPDYYLFHEYLEAENQPFYFSEFMAAAGAYRLQYMGNALSHLDLDLFDPKARSTLLEISEDIVQLEQFTDFLSNRSFRRSLLCRDHIPLDRNPPASVVAGLHVRARAEPVSANPDCYSNAPETFHVDNKKRGTTNLPLTKTMFTVLAEQYPRAVPFDQLWSTISGRLTAHGCITPEIAAQGRELLAQAVLHAYLGNFAALHMEPFPFTTTPGPRPHASRLARWQASKNRPEFSNLVHNVVTIEDIDRILLPYLDGAHSREQLNERLAQLVRTGRLSIADDDGQPLLPAAVPAAISQTIDKSLFRLARQCLLDA